MALLKSKFFKSKMFQRMLQNRSWNVQKVELVYLTHRGETVTEDASWLKDLYTRIRMPRQTAHVMRDPEYYKHEKAIEFHDDDVPMLTLRFENDLPSLSFNVGYVEEDKREWLADILERQIRKIANQAYAQGRSEVQLELSDVLNS